MACYAIVKGVVIVGAVLVFLISNVSCQGATAKRAIGISEEAAVKQLSLAIRNFTVELLYHTAQNTGNHLIISPFSVWSVLAIIAEGATGATREELARKLRLQGEDTMAVAYPAIDRLFNINTPSVEITSSNKLYADSSLQILRDYQAYIGATYKASILPVTFRNTQKAAQQINSDIYQATKGKVDSIVNEDDMRDAKMIITNAVFFKGGWTMPFKKSDTEKAPFYNDNNQQIGFVNLMYQKGPFPFVNLKSLQAYILELPYGKRHCPEIDPEDFDPDFPCIDEPGAEEEDRISMLILLPYGKVPLLKMFQNMAVIPLEDIFSRLKSAALEAEDEEAEVWIPRFKIESDIVMNKPLNDVGIFEVFDPIYAELPKIAKNTYLSRVIHKATIEVTEEGTVASAVTAGKLYDRTFPPKFKANRPFVYMIVEKTTKIILFSGIYSKPSQY